MADQLASNMTFKTFCGKVVFWAPCSVALLSLGFKTKGYLWFLKRCISEDGGSPIFHLSGCGRWLNFLPNVGLASAYVWATVATVIFAVTGKWSLAGRMTALLLLGMALDTSLGMWFHYRS